MILCAAILLIGLFKAAILLYPGIMILLYFVPIVLMWIIIYIRSNERSVYYSEFSATCFFLGIIPFVLLIFLICLIFEVGPGKPDKPCNPDDSWL